MTFFNDFTKAVSSYPTDSVKISIVDIAQNAGAGTSVNINEIWRFQVRIRNSGHLNMTNVSFHINAQNGASVGTTPAAAKAAVPNNTINFGNLAVGAHGGQQDTLTLYFQAPSVVKPANTSLVSAHISAWNANLNDILLNHSGHTFTPAGKYTTQVHPS